MQLMSVYVCAILILINYCNAVQKMRIRLDPLTLLMGCMHSMREIIIWTKTIKSVGRMEYSTEMPIGSPIECVVRSIIEYITYIFRWLLHHSCLWGMVRRGGAGCVSIFNQLLSVHKGEIRMEINGRSTNDGDKRMSGRGRSVALMPWAAWRQQVEVDIKSVLIGTTSLIVDNHVW